ncbi:MAG: phosphoribosylamine--glycine ligase [Candidatus Cloacimonetes bacterium]|nr:phosphoribosylamine--glycine ligase [Candidatus Cloacimonadota bacterium]
MNVLIIGSGGREHALAECFARSKQVNQVFVAPGNAGIAKSFTCLPLLDSDSIINYCKTNPIELVFIGPEQPIADGLSDKLEANGIKVVAPSMFAAQLETSKIFAKELMAKKSIPTARYKVVKSIEEASVVIAEFGLPIVIKEDGLAAGKGVAIAHTKYEAMQAIYKALKSSCPEPANANSGIILEEYLQGWEVSLFAFTDGRDFTSTIFVQDHKQLLDGDEGPNTGGMGAYAPVLEAECYRKDIEAKIIVPTLDAMQELGYPYKGILYCGLMITKKGPMVIEYNCRFGDPEAEVLLPLLETDLLDISRAIVNSGMKNQAVKFKDLTAVGVVMASGGYPATYGTGYQILMPEPIPEGVYFSGVAEDGNGLVTSGGRVLCIVATDNDLSIAKQKAYLKQATIHFKAETYRTDIGGRINSIPNMEN